MLRIRLLGGARKIGASAILLDTGKYKILLDYGSSPSKNPDFPLPVSPYEIDAIILSHAHIDHSGAIPILYRGAKGPLLITTPLTLELSDLLINDMIKINGDKLPFTKREVQKMMEHALPIHYNEPIELFDGIVVTLRNAGHVPGSASIEIEIDGKKIWYTGDINLTDTRLLESGDVVRDADYVIMESTYAYKDHPNRKQEEKRFYSTVKELVEDGYTVLIPSFAVGRSQEVMCILWHYGFDGRTALDGMAQTATSIFLSYPEYLRDYLELKYSARHVKWMRSKGQRRKMLKRPGAVISPAGMFSGGWSEWYLKQIYGRENAAIIFVSYQVPGTVGRKILDEKKVVIRGKEREVKARVEFFELSSHSGRSQLFDIVSSLKNPEKIIIVHGEDQVAEAFANEIYENHGIDAIAPHVGDIIYLD